MVNAKYKQQTAKLCLVIVKGDRPTMLGCDWLDTFRLSRRQIFTVRAAHNARDANLEAVLEKQKAVFEEGPSTIKEFKATIRVRTNSQSICRKARPVPYALREPVEKELERLEGKGIISKTDRSEWASPIAIAPKADKSIRICGDYKVTINQCRRGGRLFTKLDLAHAKQLELDKESEKYLTVNTHHGLYAYHRLSYGVSSVPSIFQGVMDQILQGIDHVTCFLEDILITTGSREDHLKKLGEMMSHLERYGVRMKQSKCEFMEYYGVFRAHCGQKRPPSHRP